MLLWLIRHPRPQVAPGVCYGQTDLPVADAERLRVAAALRPQLPGGLPVYSSPLQRCASLAAALATQPPRLDPRLKEMHFGCWENRPWSEIPRAEVDAWAEDLRHYQPGGGESLLQVAERLQAFLQTIARHDEREAIVVCHAGCIRLFLALNQGLPPEAAASQAHDIPYGALLPLHVARPHGASPCLAP